MSIFARRRPSLIDELSSAAIGIEFAHHEIHEGDAFFADFEDEEIADGETIILAFKTMAAPVNVHMVMEFSTLTGGNIRLWEGPTWTAETGTEVPIVNRNRVGTPNSSGILANQAQAGFVAANVVNANPTGLNTGSAMSLHHIFAWGSQAKPTGGPRRDVAEIVSKPDTQYASVFTGSGANNKAQMILNWYEHGDRSA